MDIKKSDVKKLLDDKQLINEIINGIVTNSTTLDDLEKDVAEDISDQLEDDPQLREKVLELVTESDDFRKQVVNSVVDDLTGIDKKNKDN